MGDRQFEDASDHHDERDRNALTTHSFPAQLRRLRRERGLSLTDLARRTHYSKGYLSKIETGTKRATVDVARLCDQVLGAEGELLRLVQQAPPRDGDGDGDGNGDGDTGVSERQADVACPYRGLSAFTPQDAEWFFGRERATAALVERIFERVGGGPLMLVAPSGAGKSSLLNAGLVPALRRGDFPMPGADRWPAVLLTPTSRPLDELLERTAKAVGGDLGVTVEELREDPGALLDAVREMSDEPSGSGSAAPGERRPPPPRPVLIVDQFEELFTLCSDEEERRSFVRVLSALATARTAAEGEDSCSTSNSPTRRASGNARAATRPSSTGARGWTPYGPGPTSRTAGTGSALARRPSCGRVRPRRTAAAGRPADRSGCASRCSPRSSSCWDSP